MTKDAWLAEFKEALAGLRPDTGVRFRAAIAASEWVANQTSDPAAAAKRWVAARRQEQAKAPAAKR